MTTKPFNLEEAKAGAKLVTRDGRPARIGIWDAKGHYPLVGCILSEDGYELEESWTLHGDSSHNVAPLDKDLLILCEPKLRAWKPEEVPLGAWLANKSDHSVVWIITGRADDQIFCGPPATYGTSLTVAFDCLEHSTDGGKTWKNCGIEK